MSKTLIVKCPTCDHTVAWSDKNPNKPFCSERCKLIDLGEWASEGHRIAGKPLDPETVEQLNRNQE